MADLLECVIQIKALGETLEWVTRMKGGADTSACWVRLAEAERRYAFALGTDTAPRTHVAADVPGTMPPREDFLERRRANLAMLNGCTAALLGGQVDWPGRRSTKVADLVAIMLAHDTEVLGELRRARRSPACHAVARKSLGGRRRESRIPNPGE